jgi:hypothetical protein
MRRRRSVRALFLNDIADRAVFMVREVRKRRANMSVAT